MEDSNWLESSFITYLKDKKPAYIGDITQLRSTMDIPVGQITRVTRIYIYI